MSQVLHPDSVLRLSSVLMGGGEPAQSLAVLAVVWDLLFDVCVTFSFQHQHHSQHLGAVQMRLCTAFLLFHPFSEVENVTCCSLSILSARVLGRFHICKYTFQ